MSKIDSDLKILGYDYLGWMNGWGQPYPKKYTDCVNAKHSRSNISYSPRGHHNTVYCDICKFYANYDSSD